MRYTGSMKQYDLAVIGTGIVGMASAREVLRRHPRLRVAVLDKEPVIGTHQTGHNSGVIHSGIYYAPGSLKARLCVQGARDLYAYCEEKGIPTERCGKVIVASFPSELPALQELYRRGTANGVEGIEVIGPERLRELEPACVGIQAIWSPNTGIADFAKVVRAYADDVRALGGEILLNHEVLQIDMRPQGVALVTSGGDVGATSLLSCAGLYADRVARLTGAPPDPTIVPFRGDYWLLRPSKRHLTRNMIYPVPNPSFPFLGVHLTRRINDGAIWLGPNAVLAFAREGYGRLDIAPSDVADIVRNQGFRKLAATYWKTGLAEMVRDFSKGAFLKSLQQYVPSLTADDLLPGPSGVRAQALAGDGKLVDDFVVNVQDGKIVHVRNAPSPAATSSLAIGRMIADTAFGLST